MSLKYTFILGVRYIWACHQHKFRNSEIPGKLKIQDDKKKH